MDDARRVTVVIPARNEAALIGEVVQAVLAQREAGTALEVLVVDDGSIDDTAARARAAGATVLARPSTSSDGGNPAAARNLGATHATGDPIVFLDADCTPAAGWLRALLAAHARGEVCVGGSLALPPHLAASARWDYYCGWYHVHPRRSAGFVPNHPPCNLSVRRAVFLRTRGFTERAPISYSHEELVWQAQLQRSGMPIWFEPSAVAYHRNRRGFLNLLRRNYRWAYSAIESKRESGAARMAWLYRYPILLIVGSVPLALIQSLYIIACWLRVGVLEPLAVFPAVVAARVAYALGMMIGGLRWLSRGASSRQTVCPKSG